MVNYTLVYTKNSEKKEIFEEPEKIDTKSIPYYEKLRYLACLAYLYLMSYRIKRPQSAVRMHPQALRWSNKKSDKFSSHMSQLTQRQNPRIWSKRLSGDIPTSYQTDIALSNKSAAMNLKQLFSETSFK